MNTSTQQWLHGRKFSSTHDHNNNHNDGDEDDSYNNNVNRQPSPKETMSLRSEDNLYGDLFIKRTVLLLIFIQLSIYHYEVFLECKNYKKIM